MWAVSYLSPLTPCHPLPLPLIPNPTKPSPTSPLRVSVSARSQPPGQNVGGLGQSILTKLKSEPKPINPVIPKQGKQKQENEEGKPMISGSDVLFALQRATAKKRKEIGRTKKKGKVASSSVVSRMEEEAVDDDSGKFRPLIVKGEWGSRLDELEKRLEEVSSEAI